MVRQIAPFIMTPEIDRFGAFADALALWTNSNQSCVTGAWRFVKLAEILERFLQLSQRGRE